MSPLFDLYCEKCDATLVDVWLKHDEDNGTCTFCGSELKRVPGGYFKLLYDPKKDMCTWGNEGYNHSQYWDAVKAARDRGEHVKGANEE